MQEKICVRCDEMMVAVDIEMLQRENISIGRQFYKNIPAKISSKYLLKQDAFGKEVIVNKTRFCIDFHV